MKAREVASKANSKKPLNDELQNRPIVPSEAFLVLTGNIFPVADLKRQLGFVESSTDGNIIGTKGELVTNEKGEMVFEPDLHNRLRQCDYPLTDKDVDTDGAIVIWQHPRKGMTYGLVVAGTDPYAQDKTTNSPSVGATFLIERASPGGSNHDRIVAEYCGRPATIKQYNENLRRLLTYYGAIDLYENQINNVKEYFETKNCLSLLAHTPTILKSNANTSVNRVYGQHMTKQIKDELELYTRDWLIESAGDGKLNLNFIYSKPLLQELIAYNEDGNFDRVIGLMLAICQKLQMHKIVSKKKEEIKRDDFFSRKLFV